MFYFYAHINKCIFFSFSRLLLDLPKTNLLRLCLTLTLIFCHLQSVRLTFRSTWNWLFPAWLQLSAWLLLSFCSMDLSWASFTQHEFEMPFWSKSQCNCGTKPETKPLLRETEWQDKESRTKWNCNCQVLKFCPQSVHGLFDIIRM